jgi:hypothetical protein
LQGAQQLQHFLPAACVERGREAAFDALHHGGGPRQFPRARALFQQPLREQLQPLARVALVAPRIGADRLQQRGTRALPGPGRVDVERVEGLAGQQVLRQRAEQPGVRARAVQRRVARERQQRVAPQPLARRGAEHVQPVADLRFLQLAQVGIDTREHRVVLLFRARHAQLFDQVLRAHRREDLRAQHLGAARIDQQRVVVLVDLALQVLQRTVVLRARERRHQVVDDDRLRAPLGLRALARIVDDEGVHVGQRAEHGVGPAGLRQRDALARQPFEVAVLADMHHRIDGEHVAQPEVERQVAVRRHQFRVVVARVVGRAKLAERARGLDADEHAAQPQPGDHEAALAHHRVLPGVPQRASMAAAMPSGSAARRAS